MGRAGRITESGTRWEGARGGMGKEEEGEGEGEGRGGEGQNRRERGERVRQPQQGSNQGRVAPASPVLQPMKRPAMYKAKSRASL